MAVHTAVGEAFPGSKCDAAVAGGNGSVQVSMKHEFRSAAIGLGDETLTCITESGVDAYREKIRPAVALAFGHAAERLKLVPRPLGIVVISSFYYAAVRSPNRCCCCYC
jgi:hypothetical protein